MPKAQKPETVEVTIIKERWRYTSPFSGGFDTGWHGFIYSPEDSSAIYYRTRDRMVGSDGSWKPLSPEEHEYDENAQQLQVFSMVPFSGIEQQAETLRDFDLRRKDAREWQKDQYAYFDKKIEKSVVPRKRLDEVKGIANYGNWSEVGKQRKSVGKFIFGEIGLVCPPHTKRF